MEFRDFCNHIEDEIRSYLPDQYADAEIVLQDTVKQADVHLTGIIIRSEDEVITPCIYLDQFYQEYENGRPISAILSDIVAQRVQAAVPENLAMKEQFMAMIIDYNQAKEHLQIRLCDPQRNRELLDRCTYTMEGDFAATYRLVVSDIPEIGAGSVALTRDMLIRWGVPLSQVKEDALLCDRHREPQLLSMGDVLAGFGGPLADDLPGKKKGNLLLADSVKMDEPMYVLSNKESIDGASMILQHDIMQKIGELIGGDYYVLPSSRHEVLIVPENSSVSRENLSDMVKSINETQVAPEDFLSDEVQYYDSEKNLLMNATHYEMLQINPQEKDQMVI